MAPIRCPVSCASTSATWNRQSTCRDTPRSAWYSSSESTTRFGFFSVGALRPLRGFDARKSFPRSSLALAAQLSTAIRNFRSCSIVRSDTGFPLGPTLPDRLARMNRSQSRSDCMTCRGMCGSGRRIVGTGVTRVLRRTGTHGQAEIVPYVCCAAAPGSSLRTSSARRTATGTRPGTGTTTTRVPFGPDNKLKPASLPLHLLHGGPGGNAPWSLPSERVFALSFGFSPRAG